MGAGAFVEPAVVIGLLFGGTWFNRNKTFNLWPRRNNRHYQTVREENLRGSSPDSLSSAASSFEGLLEDGHGRAGTWRLTEQEPRWRKRTLRILGFHHEVATPNTRVFKEYFLSRLLRKFPFLVEAWYWALIYWVYQLGRAFTAITLVEGTVDVARKHALQLIHLEQALGVFHEASIQRVFLNHPTLMHWINRIYSFIHIPGTILFLVWLYYYTIIMGTRNRLNGRWSKNKDIGRNGSHRSPVGPRLYQARRRTMAFCNLLAFIVFTVWPCMPPRLLSDETYNGPDADEAKRFGFVDTVHGAEGESSVWTQNRFCNQYAAMPSLHFGYSFLIGLTIMTIPLAGEQKKLQLEQQQQQQQQSQRRGFRTVLFRHLPLRLPSSRRLLCVAVGIAYPLTILIAIIATANHFILDAVAGAFVCAVAWNCNRVLLNLLALEDYFLYCVRIHKPTPSLADAHGDDGDDGEDDEDDDDKRLSGKRFVSV